MMVDPVGKPHTFKIDYKTLKIPATSLVTLIISINGFQCFPDQEIVLQF